MTRTVIVAAKRTPQGRFLGTLARCSPVDLAVAAGRAVLQDVGPALVDQVIVGNVLSAGQGMNIARQVGVNLGLPIETPAFTVNMMCASGMQAAVLAEQAIRAGDAEVVLCGGAESMSNAPYLLERARSGYKLGDGKLVDSLLRDGVTDAFDHEHMGLSAERLAEDYGLSREALDAYAAQSQQRCATAQSNGAFEGEIVPVADLERDEHPRPDTTAEGLAKLRTAFKSDGKITAGNAAGINDGAAMLLLCSEEAAAKHGWQPLAVWQGAAAVGCDPKRMGLGPVGAVRRLTQRLECAAKDFDQIELNEAFAAQVMACFRELELADDEPTVNPHGGAIALGHPIGTSGARLLVHLAQRLGRGEIERGLATLCVGGGMGEAVALGRA